ncbi:heat shock protein 9/12-domain-containing protein [Jimgerdemannia flammicorona]|uniref:Heat shock protein 9/12-domain-containing protein n=1 Tax=Jimgerdemannia flammicorona TaxID=994334 RepID=A0A433D4W0_9FUNG|nr:heat shock protein 9/12-domain-containing protein [Jimgerdemannia flammicorona]
MISSPPRRIISGPSAIEFTEGNNQPNMSDYNRKDFTEQAKEKVTPDTQKSYTQQASEQFSSATDRLKSTITPETQKSTDQSAFDTVRGECDDAKTHPQGEGKGLLEKAKVAAGVDNKTN